MPKLHNNTKLSEIVILRDGKWICPDTSCKYLNLSSADRCCRCSLDRTTFTNQLMQNVPPTQSQELKAKPDGEPLASNNNAPKGQTDGNLKDDLFEMVRMKKVISDLAAKRKRKGDPCASADLEVAGECLKHVHELFADGAFERRMSDVDCARGCYDMGQKMLETSDGDNVEQHVRDAVKGAAHMLHLKLHDYLDNYPIDRVVRLGEQLGRAEADVRDRFPGKKVAAPFGPGDSVDSVMNAVANARSLIAANKPLQFLRNEAEEERKRIEEKGKELDDSLKTAVERMMRIASVAVRGEEPGGVPDVAQIIGEMRSLMGAERDRLLRLEKAESADVEQSAVAAEAVVALCRAKNWVDAECEKIVTTFGEAVDLAEQWDFRLECENPMAKAGLGQSHKDAEGDNKPAALDSMVAARSTSKDVASLW